MGEIDRPCDAIGIPCLLHLFPHRLWLYPWRAGSGAAAGGV
jgi:hypothetical protein